MIERKIRYRTFFANIHKFLIYRLPKNIEVGGFVDNMTPAAGNLPKIILFRQFCPTAASGEPDEKKRRRVGQYLFI